MSKYLNEIQENEAKMTEIRSSINAGVLSYRKKLADEMNAIRADGDLSEGGKQRKMAEMKEQLAATFQKQAAETYAEYVRLASSNIAKAELALVEEKPEPADKTKAALYDRAKSDLQTRLLFSVSSATAMKEFEAFVQAHSSEPAFAADIAANFGSLASQLISTASAKEQPAMKDNLRKMYESTIEAGKTDGLRQAEAALYRAKADQRAKIFGVEATAAANEMFGGQVADSLNKLI